MPVPGVEDCRAETVGDEHEASAVAELEVADLPALAPEQRDRLAGGRVPEADAGPRGGEQAPSVRAEADVGDVVPRVPDERPGVVKLGDGLARRGPDHVERVTAENERDRPVRGLCDGFSDPAEAPVGPHRDELPVPVGDHRTGRHDESAPGPVQSPDRRAEPLVRRDGAPDSDGSRR